MFKQFSLGVTLVAINAVAFAANTHMQIKTSAGNIDIELFNDKAPISAKNFENYVKANFYNGTIFHRVIPGFMIQGGGMDATMNEKPNRPPIKNESYNGLKNDRGTLAMARTNQPDSATSQFFINVADNTFLNKAPMNPGYAVFGKVTNGLDIVDKIAAAPTGRYGMHQDVPKNPIKILSVNIKPAKVK